MDNKILNHKMIGSANPPTLILHGLFGSMKNWSANGKELAELTKVCLVDLRNHGDSFHSKSHHLMDMVADIGLLSQHLNISPFNLLGHSMGGFVAMLFAIKNPEKINRLIVVDIAPRSYFLDYSDEFAALSMDVSGYVNRKELDKDMKKILGNDFIRQFLQMNLQRYPEGGYFWKINVNAIKNSHHRFEFDWQSLPPYHGPTLFILGENSSFIVADSDVAKIYSLFPNAQIEWLAGAEHYLHYSHAQPFLQLVKNFIASG